VSAAEYPQAVHKGLYSPGGRYSVLFTSSRLLAVCSFLSPKFVLEGIYAGTNKDPELYKDILNLTAL
jgi:hypothetical protein